MIDCSVRELTKFYGSNKVFENITFEIKEGDRIGLIGQNGCGKTTLLKILMGIEDYKSGVIGFRKGLTIGYLEQTYKMEESITVSDVLWQAFSEVIELKKKMNDLEKSFSILKDSELDNAMFKYGKYLEKYECLDGYQLDTKFKKVCEGLNIKDNILEMIFEKLSGGEKTRIVLGKILLESPDILLLDEPSNHLDISTIEWLENYLLEYKGTVIIISHDRYFLDRVVNMIYELNSDCVEVYKGNYSSYVVEKEKRFLEDFKRYQNQQKEIDRVKNQIHRYRVWGAMRDSEVMYKRAKELEKRLEKVQVLDRPILERRRIRIDSSVDNRSGKIVAKVTGIHKSFNEKKLMKNINFDIFYKDSICLMGANGSGKTTLIKIIMEEIEPDKGSVKIGERVKVGYLPQNIVFEDEEKTILEYFSYYHSITTGEARGVLAKMLFVKEDVNKKIKNLSGGEKSRLKLCSLTYEKVNFLILDEPTNHLDIESREELEQSLVFFEGTIFFVSHDRYFIQKVAEKILWLEKGLIKEYPFGYDDFLEKRKIKITEKQKQPVKAKKNNEKAEKKKVPNSFKYNEIEKEIETLEENKNNILKKIEKNQTDYILITDLMNEKEEIDRELDYLYSKWEEFLN